MNSASIAAATLPAAGRDTAAAAYTAVMGGIADQLAGLSPTQGEAPTDCAGWSVRDIAAHLLGAQEDLMSVRTTLRHRMAGRRRYPRLSPLDAANQAQIDAHHGDSTEGILQAYRANIPKVARRVRTFPQALSRIPVDPTMAPANSPLRLGYLFNVIYLRDAWMHGVDIERATGQPRSVTAAEPLVLAQVMRDASIEWGVGPGLDVELTGAVAGTWHLGAGGAETRAAGVGLEFVRGLSGRKPDTALECLAGAPETTQRLGALRILF